MTLYTCDAEHHATYETYKARHGSVTDFKGREPYPLATRKQWKARRRLAEDCQPKAFESHVIRPDGSVSTYSLTHEHLQNLLEEGDHR